MNADDLAGHPALKRERDLLADALRSGTPTLGVCLGAQLLARAHGLTVRTGAELGHPREIGWSPLYGVDRDDPVVGPLADAPAVLHWHGDRIVPAPGTRVLARTDTTRCQAFRAARPPGAFSSTWRSLPAFWTTGSPKRPSPPRPGTPSAPTPWPGCKLTPAQPPQPYARWPSGA